MTVREAVGAIPYFWLQLSGYLVFAAAWVFISLAVMRGLVDLTSAIARHGAARSSSPVRAIGDNDSARFLSPIPAASTSGAVRARVFAFPPKKTRTRLVVR